MAKQNSATDPISAAMSAIESALNLTDDDVLASAPAEKPAPTPPSPPARTATPVLRPSATPAEPTPLLRPSAPPQSATSEGEPKPTLPSTPPANDDREVVGAILQAINTRPPSRTPFVLAVIGSLAWLAICALYGYLNVWPTISSVPLAQTLFRPENSAPGSGGARPDLLHFRLRRARPQARRTAPVRPGDLAGRGAPRRARVHRRRPCGDAFPGDPPGTDVDGRWRRARPRARRRTRNPREVRGFDARAVLFGQRA